LEKTLKPDPIFAATEKREKEKWIGESNGAVHLYGGVL